MVRDLCLATWRWSCSRGDVACGILSSSWNVFRFVVDFIRIHIIGTDYELTNNIASVLKTLGLGNVPI